MENFQYDNEWANDYQLKICSFESDSGVNITDTGSQLSDEQIKVVGTDEFLTINNDYSSPISFTFQTCSFNSDCTPKEITPEEFSNINRWANRKEAHKFKIDKTGYEEIYFLGKFNIKAIKINGIIYGVEFTFLSNYPYGFADEIVQVYSGKEFMVYNHSDEIGFLMPKINIICKESGTLRIRNDMDNEVFELTECTENEIIQIDGKNMVITSNNPNHKLYDCFNFNYIKLCNTYNERKNNFTSTLDIEMEIKYSPVRKVGI